MDALQNYRAFVRVIEVGSFSAVARELGISQSGVSKQIASLEASIGTQLFARTTRKLRPTEEALRLYPHIRQFVDAMESMMSSEDEDKNQVSGLLRVSMPSSFGRRCIVPFLPEFLCRYPQVAVDVQFSDALIDLVEEGLELAIYIGTLPPSSLVARSLGTVRNKLVASPSYLARYSPPDTPLDITGHNCIAFSSSPQSRRWEFDSEHGRQVVDVPGIISMSDVDAMHECVSAGLGLAQLPEWLVNDDIAKGKLVWLLPEYYPIPQPVRFIYPQTRFLSQRARCFIDTVVELTKANNSEVTYSGWDF